jgi:hypothetical protein
MNADETGLTVSSCVFRRNVAETNQGGGGLRIWNSGVFPVRTLITDCVFTENSAPRSGGLSVENNSDTVTAQIERTTISNNRATQYFGGAAYFSGRAAVTGCTIDGNLTFSGTAVVAASALGAVTFTNCTVTNNRGLTSPNGDGGITFDNTSCVIRNTVVAGNGVRGDIFGTLTSLGYNFIGDRGTATIYGPQTGDQMGTAAAPLDPKLGPLQDNGGPMLTRLPLPGSPLIDAGDPAFVPPPTTDQRGRPRVQNGRIDIGATEAQMSHVQSVLVKGGAAQRSRVTNAIIIFDSAVTLPATPAIAFRLTRTGPGGPIGDVTLAVDLSASTTAQTIATLTFSGPLTEFGSLIDGNYTLTVLGSQVLGEGGFLLDGDGNGTVGGDNVTPLFRLYGDVNLSKSVDGLDLTAFRTAFGTAVGDTRYLSYLDFNGDGVINGADLAEFRKRFGMILP